MARSWQEAVHIRLVEGWSGNDTRSSSYLTWILCRVYQLKGTYMLIDTRIIERSSSVVLTRVILSLRRQPRAPR
jgi:hypothetical protein